MAATRPWTGRIRLTTVAEMTLLLRFTAGGLIVATIPIVSARLSPRVAGVLVLIPAITLLSFAFIGADQGMIAVSKASAAAILSLPTVLGFLAGVNFVARREGGLIAALSFGFLAWLAIAIPIAGFLHGR